MVMDPHPRKYLVQAYYEVVPSVGVTVATLAKYHFSLIINCK
jgi:hypothetical protein